MTSLFPHIKSKLHRFSFFLVFCISLIQLQAQSGTRLDFDADYVMYDENIGDGAERWIGNVVFKHAGSVMYCDSVYYYSDTNIADAYGSVHIIKDDSLHVWGDYLNYNGNTKLAKVRQNVRLVDKETELTTTAIDYDLENSIGYYVNHARILNGENILTSKEGYYYANEQLYYFRKDVVVDNPDYKIESDTLKYNTETDISYILGPTHIYSDSSYIYCEEGWFNTVTNISELRKNAYVKDGSQEIWADSIYYEKDNQYGIARNNVEIVDQDQNIVFRGHYAITNEVEETALLTKEALLIMVTEEKDSIFIHADTLRVEPDTTGYKLVRAYYKVKLFKEDLQGKCDSMSYALVDSIIRMYTDPVMWTQENQLSAEYIEIRTKNNQIHELYMNKNAFLISEVDSTKYNQINGRTITGHFKDNELYKMDVEGNGQMVYFPMDGKEVIGVNVAVSSNIIIHLVDREVDKVYFVNKPSAVLYPLSKAPKDKMFLKGFMWQDYQRPKSKNDIFLWNE